MAKRILVTGAGSYIGKSFQKYMSKFSDYEIKMVKVSDGSWEKEDFSEYDVCLHVAGIAHKRETKENESLYYKVNRDISFNIAQKARNNNIGQFIYLSSMSVYGILQGNIDDKTLLKPVNAYGKSKLEAENLIKNLDIDTFSVCIIRPPMVYGKNCTGNFTRLVQFLNNTIIFPNISNQRSMIFIDNLCEYIKNIIDKKIIGVGCPQDKNYVSTQKIAEILAEKNNKKIIFFSVFNPVIQLLKNKVGIISKVFGNLTYEKGLAIIPESEYCKTDIEDAVRLSI